MLGLGSVYLDTCLVLGVLALAGAAAQWERADARSSELRLRYLAGSAQGFPEDVFKNAFL